MDAAMRDYYEQRAAEYDDWWLGTGLFAQRDRPGWHEDVQGLIAALRALPPKRTIDLACGTGFLTRELPGEVTAIDQSEAMVAIARSRGVDARAGDALEPREGYERAFASHFYGHLDAEQRARLKLVPAPELVIVDSALRPGAPAEDWQERVLNDGSRHRVYKRWFTAQSLAAELGGGRTVYAGPWFVAVSSSLRS
jgi:SAM-dependent methyltransferase